MKELQLAKRIDINGFLLTAVMLSILLIPSFLRGLYGIDWTDSTYTFQEALNVINGLVPQKDTNPPVPGLSFLVEAWILKLFGVNYYVHRFLGLAISLLTFLSCYIVFVNSGLKKADAIVITLLAALLHVGIQSVYSFTNLAVAMTLSLSAALAYLTRRGSINLHFYSSIFLGFSLGTIVLTKQSIGLSVTVAFLIGYLSNLVLTREINFKKSKGIDPSFYGLTIGLLFIFLFYLLWIGLEGAVTFVNLLTSSGEMKGLKNVSFLDQVLSGVGIVPSWRGVGVFAIFFVGVYVALIRNSKAIQIFRTLLFYIVILSPIFVVFVSNGLVRALTWYLHQSVVLAALLQMFFTACKFALPSKTQFASIANDDSRKVARVLPLLLVLEAGIFAHQLSWPGTSYMSFELSYTAALIAVYFKAPKTLFAAGSVSDIFSKFGVGIFVLALLLYSAIAPVVDYRVVSWKDGNYSASNLKEFMNFPVSKSDSDAILEIKNSVNNCTAKTLFQFPWAPILYTITGLDNPTRYFLPYADTITELDGSLIVNELKRNPPDMFIVEPYSIHKENPFPAKGMKLIYSYVSSADFQGAYVLHKMIKTDYKEWLIFCRSD